MQAAVEKLPLKLDTVMGEDNTEFSRGEVRDGFLCAVKVEIDVASLETVAMLC